MVQKGSKKVPIEDVECEIFVKELEQNYPDIKFSHIANESRSGGQYAKIRGAKLRRMGQRPGMWDYELFIPVYDIDGEVGSYQEIRIEMKRQRGGGSTTSKDQKGWGKVYDLAGIPCKVCFGAKEALEYVAQIVLQCNA